MRLQDPDFSDDMLRKIPVAHLNASEDMPKGWTVKAGVHRADSVSIARPGSFPPCALDDVAEAPTPSVVSDPMDLSHIAEVSAGGSTAPAGGDPTRSRSDREESLGGAGGSTAPAGIPQDRSLQHQLLDADMVTKLVALRGVPSRVIELGYEPAAGYYSPSNPVVSDEMQWDLHQRFSQAQMTVERERLWCEDSSVKIWKLYGGDKAPQGAPQTDADMGVATVGEPH